jgi:hypothetical protein
MLGCADGVEAGEGGCGVPRLADDVEAGEVGRGVEAAGDVADALRLGRRRSPNLSREPC